MSVDQLREDLAECAVLLRQAKGERVRGVLDRERAAIVREINAVEEKERAAEVARVKKEEAASEKPAAAGAVKPLKDFRSYSWEQTPKTLKIRATYPAGMKPADGTAVWKGNQDNIIVTFDCATATLRLLIENLEKPINADKVTFKYKSDYVLISLPKQTEGNWINLKTKDLGQSNLGKTGVCQFFSFFVEMLVFMGILKGSTYRQLTAGVDLGSLVMSPKSGGGAGSATRAGSVGAGGVLGPSSSSSSSLLPPFATWLLPPPCPT